MVQGRQRAELDEAGERSLTRKLPLRCEPEPGTSTPAQWEEREEEGWGGGGVGFGVWVCFLVLYVRFVICCCGSLSKGSGVRDGNGSLRWDWGAGCVWGGGVGRREREGGEIAAACRWKSCCCERES